MQRDPQSTIRVIFFGDSICVGQGFSIFGGWVTRIAQELDELSREINREILVTNASVNGRTTRQALEDMPYQVQSQGVDILLVQYGLNDCNYWQTDRGVPRVSRAAFQANLQEIIERGRRSGARYVLLNNNHPTSRYKEIMPDTEITYEDSNRSYSEAVREIAATVSSELIFTDIAKAFEQQVAAGTPIEDFLLADGLHLAAKGHDLYLETMRQKLKTVVKEFAEC